MLIGKLLLHLSQRDVGLGGYETEQDLSVLVRLGAPRLTLSPGGRLSALPSSADPHNGGRHPHAEMRGRLPCRQAAGYRVQDTHPQILTVCPSHRSPPVHHREQRIVPSPEGGSPTESEKAEPALDPTPDHLL
jgi:hypothetical protein